MIKPGFSWRKFDAVPIVGIMRGISLSDIKNIAPIYTSSGLTTIEVTMNTPGAEEIIRFLSEDFSDKLNIGAGTVCNTDDLKTALSAGATFIVTPIVSKSVIEQCKEKEIPVFPGAFTPTEIYTAWQLGADMVKVYPSEFLGPRYISNVKAPLNQIKLMPTGGITPENCASFLAAGADGLGIGSGLFNKKIIQSQDWDALENIFSSFVRHFLKPDNTRTADTLMK